MVKYKILGGQVENVTSAKIVTQCKAIDEFMADGSEKTLSGLRGILQLFDPVDSITRDRLRGQALLHEARGALQSAG